MADEYLDKLHAGLKATVEASEAGRADVDGMIAPVDKAIHFVTGAAAEITNLPFVSPALGVKLQRVTRAIGIAQGKVNKVLSNYDRYARKVKVLQGKVDKLKQASDAAKKAADDQAAKDAKAPDAAVSTAAFAPDATPAPEAVTGFPHLMILQPLSAHSKPYYFNLDTSAFDSLRRTNAYRWASQERLTRRPAQQAVGVGEEKMTLKGVIFPGFKGGLKQLDVLRSIGQQLKPFSLVTGYGAVLGNWCLANIDEDQEALLKGGIPRKQTFTLEFVRYGDDMQNI